MPFGDEIAVLDGLDLGGHTMSMSIEDGRIGREPASVSQYARPASHNYQTRRNVIDAGEGALYQGGSSYAPGLPLMPSSVGLADADLISYSRVTNVLPPRRNVINLSQGANYSGGSNYSAGMPLVTSGDAGLADPYETYSDFAGVPLGALDAAFGSSISIEDGRIGRQPAAVDQYARSASHNYQTRRNVIDAGEGALYQGGSSYAPGLPLMPSSIGLAGLAGGRLKANYRKVVKYARKYNKLVAQGKIRKASHMLRTLVQRNEKMYAMVKAYLTDSNYQMKVKRYLAGR